VLESTLDALSEVKDSLKKSGPIRFAKLDPSKTHLVTLADDKLLKLWKVDGLELLHERYDKPIRLVTFDSNFCFGQRTPKKTNKCSIH
jgi:WD40 repeat protein